MLRALDFTEQWNFVMWDEKELFKSMRNFPRFSKSKENFLVVRAVS